MNFRDFSESLDLQNQSHRALNTILIPKWLQESPQDLDGRIESSAYGETPENITLSLITLLDLGPQDLFLDLGAGAGNVIYSTLRAGVPSLGLERNPNLVEAGHFFLSQAGFATTCLQCADFLKHPWTGASKVFSATARFSSQTLATVKEKIETHSQISRAAFLGKDVYLGSGWSPLAPSHHQVQWNRGESWLQVTLFRWQREL